MQERIQMSAAAPVRENDGFQDRCTPGGQSCHDHTVNRGELLEVRLALFLRCKIGNDGQ